MATQFLSTSLDVWRCPTRRAFNPFASVRGRPSHVCGLNEILSSRIVQVILVGIDCTSLQGSSSICSISGIKELAHVYSLFTSGTTCTGSGNQQLRLAVCPAKFRICSRAEQADLLPQASVLLFDQGQVLFTVLSSTECGRSR